MKNAVLLLLMTLLSSCSKPENSGNKNILLAEEALATKSISDPIAEGKSLIENADCLSCHELNERMIGPSYKEVAEKYENTPENVEMLADKIIKGSSGVWGDVPMPAHGLSKENAKFMAQYILSLK